MQSPELTAYLERMTSPELPVLQELYRTTHLRVNLPHMISGHYQGRLLTLLTQMIRPQRVLEVGTFTGYTAICFALGLPDGGEVHTIEKNEELEDLIREYLDKAGVAERVRLFIGDALEVIPTLTEVYDLVFIDATKIEYDDYYESLFDKVAAGGFILSDNVLWDGKVLREPHDKKTAAMHRFNQRIQDDPRVENLLLPIRDGIMIARKR